MVLSSMISAGEASELRSLVMNHKVSLADVFNIISHKKDPELLGELRRFSDGHKKYILTAFDYFIPSYLKLSMNDPMIVVLVAYSM